LQPDDVPLVKMALLQNAHATVAMRKMPRARVTRAAMRKMLRARAPKAQMRKILRARAPRVA